MLKQVMVLRKDLNMRKGKMVSQGAHAALKVFTDQMHPNPNGSFSHTVTDEMKQWLNGLYTKICVGVDSEEELLEIYSLAVGAKLPAALICDAGLTEFGGMPTYTAVAIGLASGEKIDRITGHLKLL